VEKFKRFNQMMVTLVSNDSNVKIISTFFTKIVFIGALYFVGHKTDIN